MSSRAEPFLRASLESIYDAVDMAVINDNSGQCSNENLNRVKETRLFKEGRIKIIKSTFSGFADARNTCIDYINEENLPDCWMLKLDTDEVHTPALKVLTRNILPALKSDTRAVDGYYYQFMQSFNYIYSIERRHHLLVRYRPGIYWEGKVHEKLVGIDGRTLVTPYVFYHYGYNFSKEDVLEKWKLYARWGDKSFPELDKVEIKYFLNWEGRFCFKFPYIHPPAARESIDEIMAKRGSEVTKYEEMVRLYNKDFIRRTKIFFRSKNYFLRLFFRGLMSGTGRRLMFR